MIVVRLAIKNLEESDCLMVVNIKQTDLLSIKIVIFSDDQSGMQRVKCEESDFLAVKNVKSLTF